MREPAPGSLMAVPGAPVGSRRSRGEAESVNRSAVSDSAAPWTV